MGSVQHVVDTTTTKLENGRSNMIQVINPSITVRAFDRNAINTHLEWAGRKCYKSEDRIGSETAPPFLQMVIKRGHESILEHAVITVLFIIDRGISHELVRHRIAAYSQESTRYVNYNKKGIQFIQPWRIKQGTSDYLTWIRAMGHTTQAYNQLIENRIPPEWARSVLPNSLKTEVVATMNIRQWRHVLGQRCAKVAHPQMRQVMIPLLLYLQRDLPPLFDSILYDEEFPQEYYAEVLEEELNNGSNL